MSYKEKYQAWLDSEIISEEIKDELRAIKDEKEIEDRFYKDLEFGTGGLRGVIGAGSNRMNIYTVSQATQGFADYLNANFENPSVAIAYDSRNMSPEFAKAAALTLCANNIKVNLFESLRPTPMLSFAVRELKCDGGIVITASHNPKIYNGYKAYDQFGCQLTDKPAKEVIDYVAKVSDFSMIKTISEEEALNKGLLKMIGEDVDKVYIEKVKSLAINTELVKEKAKDLKIIYTPIHGSGNIPVRRVLKELGYENVKVVKEQEAPNGEFPTAPYPNPEMPQVFELALKMAETEKPDIIFGTDPDCDRIGVVVNANGEYKVLTGNQTGLLLTDYVLNAKKETNTLPENGVVIKTIVTTEGARKIAENYGVECMDVLTGFKYIGEKIHEFEVNNDKTYLFGFEESYGYLSGSYVRDKDGVNGAYLIAEMFAYYKTRGISLLEKLNELFSTYGYCLNTLHSFTFEGASGFTKMQEIMKEFHKGLDSIGGLKVERTEDYSKGLNGLPKSDVLKYLLEGNCSVVVRPSGTEPKLKTYISVSAKTKDDAEEIEKKITEELNEFFK